MTDKQFLRLRVGDKVEALDPLKGWVIGSVTRIVHEEENESAFYVDAGERPSDCSLVVCGENLRVCNIRESSK
jgi:hypothetical protein